jgi:hypothetical protein
MGTGVTVGEGTGVFVGNGNGVAAGVADGLLIEIAVGARDGLDEQAAKISAAKKRMTFVFMFSLAMLFEMMEIPKAV